MPIAVHNRLQDANRRSPWRAQWLNDSAAAEYRVDVQTVLRHQPSATTDEPEIADEDALHLTGAEWTRALRHAGKANPALASAKSKLKDGRRSRKDIILTAGKETIPVFKEELAEVKSRKAKHLAATPPPPSSRR